MDAVTKSIDNKTFQILPFTARKALNIERKIMAVLIPIFTPIISSEGKFDLDKNIDLTGIGQGFNDGLGQLTDEQFDMLISETLRNVTYVPTGKAPLSLADDNGFDQAFKGSLITCYKLIWEVMKVNKFCFLGFMDGLSMNTIDTSNEVKKK